MTDLFELHRFFYMSPFFLFGILLRKGDLCVRGVAPNIVIAAGLVLLVLSFCGLSELRTITVSNLAIALGLCVLFIRMFQYHALAESFVLKFCGRHSLEIYLIHTYVISAEARPLLSHQCLGLVSAILGALDRRSSLHRCSPPENQPPQPDFPPGLRLA